MIKVDLSEKDYNELMSCLDVALKTGGLSIMPTVVNLFNIMNAAKEQYEVAQKASGDPKQYVKE